MHSEYPNITADVQMTNSSQARMLEAGRTEFFNAFNYPLDAPSKLLQVALPTFASRELSHVIFYCFLVLAGRDGNDAGAKV